MEEKVPIKRLFKASKDKFFHKFGIAFGTFMLMIGISVGAFIIISLALSGTVLSPVMQKMMEATDEASMIRAQQEILDMLNTPRYMLISQLISAFIGALLATLSTGYLRVCLKISRSEQPSVKDLFFVYRNNPDKVILIYFIIFFITSIINLPTDVMTYFIQLNPENTTLNTVFLPVFLAELALTFIFSLWVFPVFYSYVDDPDSSVVDLFKKSFELMKHNKRRLFAMEMIFVGILAAGIIIILFSLGTALLLITPYVIMTFTELYRNINGEKLWISTSNYQGNLESDIPKSPLL